MTQAKKTKKTGMNLQQSFLKLDPKDQQGVTNFFNAHNIAHFLYDNLSEEAKKYVTYCINLSQSADRLEKKQEKENGAHES